MHDLGEVSEKELIDIYQDCQKQNTMRHWKTWKWKPLDHVKVGSVR